MTCDAGGVADLSRSGQGSSGAALIETGKRDLESLSKSSSGQVQLLPHTTTYPCLFTMQAKAILISGPAQACLRLCVPLDWLLCMQLLMDTDAGGQGMSTGASEANATAQVHFSAPKLINDMYSSLNAILKSRSLLCAPY